jgi:hypothetical protein
MEKVQDKNTRYFLTIDIETMKVVGHDYEQKLYLDKGRQPSHTIHRLFVSKGQYDKFLQRCQSE